MPTRCVVPKCTDYQKAADIGIPFHCFPKDDTMRKQWLVKIKNKHLGVNKTCVQLRGYRVCGKHFKPSDYEDDVKHLMAPHLYKPANILKPDSVPSIFDFEEIIQPPPVRGAYAKRERMRAASASASATITSPQEEAQSQEQTHSPLLKQRRLEIDLPIPLSSPSKFSEFSSPTKLSLSPSWKASSSSAPESSEESIESGDSDIGAAAVNENDKAMVYTSHIQQLFKRCQTCGEGIISAVPSYRGAHIMVAWECVTGHIGTWHGGPSIRGMPQMNLLAAANILYTGNTYTSIAKFAELLDLKFIKPATFNNIQNTYLIPIIDERFRLEQDIMIGEMIVKGMDGMRVSLLGDGRSDSPGFSAKYTTYSMMEEESEKIVDMKLIQVTEASSSVAMEKLGFTRSLEMFLEHDIDVATVTTDRSPSIRKLMRETYAYIDHQLDVWHVCKGVKKKICAAGKKKGNEDLLAWTKSITNHLWFCCATCNGSVEELRRKWKSMLQHVVGVHRWEEAGQVFTCEHDPLTEEQVLRKKWLNPNSPAYKSLRNIINDKRLEKDLSQLTQFKHTGSLESYHSAMLKFVPKRLHFHYPAMRARAQLAVLDHNFNVGRKQAVNRKGELKYRIVNRKQDDAATFKAKKVYEDKSYDYVRELIDSTIERRKDPSIKMKDRQFFVELPDLPKNISKVARPPREEIIAAARK